ncbi:contact-dependent growth inhibition system immunity protein [Nocardia sp. alder85J]|uniref:contact-dependent growth inhibition system immunity protein n=1 Tax=Nocardia sp. alder85J TaxID=2862949 RepID=UPI001CD6F9D6|nr:contact-dependent growth inhibition system immunity protein [Nocardia sp. alder85J]MCX4094998.1 contact-dependent growth inhibition system immunity protein [Nocardia sp. alder85J]
MRSAAESLILDLITEFRFAVERGRPREMAALMCDEEAQQFLDNVSDPDSEGYAEPPGEPTFEVSSVRVLGNLALARIIHAPDRTTTLFFRHEAGRWTVCADAVEDLSVEQLEDDVWPAPPADATTLMRTVHELRRTPIGRLTVEDVRCLLQQHEGVDILLPRAAIRLGWNPLAAGDLFPGDLLLAVLRIGPEHWARDPVSLVRIRHAVGTVRDLGDLTEHDAPHDEIWRETTEFLATLPAEQPSGATGVTGE